MGIDKGGRPPTHDREKLAIELVEWAALEDSLNLNAFCITRKPPIAPQKVSHFAEENETFREAYNIAKAAIAIRREQGLATGRLHVKAYDLNAAVYDFFLKEEKRQQAQFESSLRKDEEGNKQSTYILQVPNDLAAGSGVSTETVSVKSNKGSK